MKLLIPLIIITVALLYLTSCKVPGYTTKPDKFTLGFPYWLGGPSMTWRFEEKENTRED